MSHSELQSTNPASGEVIWATAMTPVMALDGILATAQLAQRGWSAMPLAERIKVAERFAALALQEKDAFAGLIAQETGKPFWETQTEVATVAAKVAFPLRHRPSGQGNPRMMRAALREH